MESRDDLLAAAQASESAINQLSTGSSADPPAAGDFVDGPIMQVNKSTATPTQANSSPQTSSFGLFCADIPALSAIRRDSIRAAGLDESSSGDNEESSEKGASIPPNSNTQAQAPKDEPSVALHSSFAEAQPDGIQQPVRKKRRTITPDPSVPTSKPKANATTLSSNRCRSRDVRSNTIRPGQRPTNGLGLPTPPRKPLNRSHPDSPGCCERKTASSVFKFEFTGPDIGGTVD